MRKFNLTLYPGTGFIIYLFLEKASDISSSEAIQKTSPPERPRGHGIAELAVASLVGVCLSNDGSQWRG